jgi:fumarylpyruvate hydrolase
MVGEPGRETLYLVRDGLAAPWSAIVEAGVTDVRADGVRRLREALPFDGALRAAMRATIPATSARPWAEIGPVAPPLERHPSGAFATGKILALGRSYRAHALELGNAPLERPLVFAKWPDQAVGDGATVVAPPDAEGKMDHEAELAFVIGTTAVDVPAGEGLRHVAGYLIANDLTLRQVQSAAKKAGHPWLRAKNFPGALPLGPWLTPAAAVPDPAALRIRCTVNDEVRQEAPVSQMSWDVGRIVEELSRLWPLYPGDVVSTGTPAGVSGLVPGDVCRIEIAGAGISLGTLTTRVAAS